MAAVASHLALAQNLTDQEIQQFTSAGLSPEKIGRYLDEADTVSAKWGRFAIHDPKTAWELQDKLKTPGQKVQEQHALQAITQAEEFLRLKREEEAKKDPNQRAAEDEAKAKARQAIEKPLEAAREAEKTKDAATRRREQIAERAILSPREFNEEVDRHKSEALRTKEAEVIRALTQPREVLEERIRLKKTGSAQRLKGPSGNSSDPSKGGNNAAPGAGNGPANAKGGSQ